MHSSLHLAHSRRKPSQGGSGQYLSKRPLLSKGDVESGQSVCAETSIKQSSNDSKSEHSSNRGVGTLGSRQLIACLFLCCGLFLWLFPKWDVSANQSGSITHPQSLPATAVFDEAFRGYDQRLRSMPKSHSKNQEDQSEKQSSLIINGSDRSSSSSCEYSLLNRVLFLVFRSSVQTNGKDGISEIRHTWADDNAEYLIRKGCTGDSRIHFHVRFVSTISQRFITQDSDVLVPPFDTLANGESSTALLYTLKRELVDSAVRSSSSMNPSLSFDWIMKMDDVTFLHIPNLVRYLSNLDHQTSAYRIPLWVGCPLRTSPNHPFTSGGAGYLFNRVIISQIIQSFNDGSLTVDTCASKGHIWEDMCTAYLFPRLTTEYFTMTSSSKSALNGISIAESSSSILSGNALKIVDDLEGGLYDDSSHSHSDPKQNNLIARRVLRPVDTRDERGWDTFNVFEPLTLSGVAGGIYRLSKVDWFHRYHWYHHSKVDEISRHPVTFHYVQSHGMRPLHRMFFDEKVRSVLIDQHSDPSLVSSTMRQLFVYLRTEEEVQKLLSYFREVWALPT